METDGLAGEGHFPCERPRLTSGKTAFPTDHGLDGQFAQSRQTPLWLSGSVVVVL